LGVGVARPQGENRVASGAHWDFLAVQRKEKVHEVGEKLSGRRESPGPRRDLSKKTLRSLGYQAKRKDEGENPNRKERGPCKAKDLGSKGGGCRS